MKSLLVREIVDRLGDHALERRARSDIDDAATAGAEQMVMVLGEVLGQFEAGELIAGGNAADDPGTLEIDEMPVRRASRHAGELRGDVGDTDRMAIGRQELDDRPSARGVALIHAPEAELHQVMQVLIRRMRMRYGVSHRSLSFSRARTGTVCLRGAHRQG
jgi:hypothetical protein